jgi:hypothetical protein
MFVVIVKVRLWVGCGMDILLISILIALIVNIALTFFVFIRLAGIIVGTSQGLIDTIGPISEITENIAGLPDDFDPFQHDIKMTLLNYFKDRIINNEQNNFDRMKEVNRADNGQFQQKVTLD